MNHADRQRLSNVLRTLANEIDHSNPDIYKPDHTEMTRLINEARAIVDAPAPPQRTIPPNPGYSTEKPLWPAREIDLTIPPPTDNAWLRSTIIQGSGNPTPSKEQISEFFAAPIPAREIDLDHLQSIWQARNHAERIRNRAWAAGLATAATAIICVALLSADAPPNPGPTVRVTPDRPLATPSRAAEDHIRATLPTRTEGTGQ